MASAKRLAQATHDKRVAAVATQRALYGERCVWCQSALDWDKETAPIDRGLRCGDAKAVNGLPACDACIADRGDDALSDYSLRATAPNCSVLWAMLRTVIDANPGGRMAALARIEQDALWRGVASNQRPVELGPDVHAIVAWARKRKTLWRRDGDQCVWCSRPMAFEKTTIEHLHPQSLGGGNELANLALACKACNSSRGSIEVHEWLARSAPKPRLAVLAARGYAPAVEVPTLVAAALAFSAQSATLCV